MPNSVLQIHWPTAPTFGGAAMQLFVGAVVGVAPLSAMFLLAVVCDLSYFQGMPLVLQVWSIQHTKAVSALSPSVSTTLPWKLTSPAV